MKNMRYACSDIRAALELATRLKAEGKYDLFRGQTCAQWKVQPSLMRVSKDQQAATLEKLRRFDYWTQTTPGVETLGQDVDAMLAVAQHYGLPTALLDWTPNPRIAAFFAIDG